MNGWSLLILSLTVTERHAHNIYLCVCSNEREVRLTQKGLLASNATAIPFARIANVRVATRYDDDGYGADVAELVLLNGTAIALPASASSDEITALKRAIGLG